MGEKNRGERWAIERNDMARRAKERERARHGETDRRGSKRRDIGIAVAAAAIHILCTPVKWPMQIERHRRTVGVHVTVNEPISTSFLLFDAFSTVPSIAEPGRRQIAIYGEFSSFCQPAGGLLPRMWRDLEIRGPFMG